MEIYLFSYKHAIDGMARVVKEEGFSKLFSGVDWATSRAVRPLSLPKILYRASRTVPPPSWLKSRL